MIKVLSFGGGIQTTALAIMVTQGRVQTDVIVMADPGSESAGTYRYLEMFVPWLRKRGRELAVVKAKAGPLYEYVMDRSAVIPVRVGKDEAIGHRQCTRQWKITPVYEYAKSIAGDGPIVMQLGISIDEVHRAKPSQDKRVTREWPLIDLGMTREDCRRVILDAGLPEPPKSACYFCPLLPGSHFARLAAEEPQAFEAAAVLEDAIIERRVAKGQRPAYLTAKGRPLRDVIALGQSILWPSTEGDECEGTCFV